MKDDRHEEPCARDVGARVDVVAESAQGADAPQKKAVAARPSAKLAGRRAAQQDAAPLLTSDWNEHRSQLLRVFFRDAAPLAARYRVSGEDVAEHAHALARPRIERGSLLKPVVCVADLAVATACCLGRANAWNELWVFAEPSMTRAAFSRLPETLALTWTRRYWTQLERISRNGTGGLALYDGSRPIRLWIVEQLLGTLEEERAAGRLEIRREHLGRPIPLRLVGEQLA
jgi:hypothetical protein